MKSRKEIQEKLEECEDWLDENEGLGYAEEGVEAGWSDALRWVLDDQITTLGGLWTLPVGSIVLTKHSVLYLKRSGGWSEVRGTDVFQPNLGWLPADVIYRPEVREGTDE